MKAFLKWLLDVVSVLPGIAGFYWLPILLGRGLGNSGTQGLLSRYSNYLFMIGLPAALSVKPVYLATYNIHQSKKAAKCTHAPKQSGQRARASDNAVMPRRKRCSLCLYD